MQPSKRRKESDKQAQTASTARTEQDCLLVAPLRAVITDWCDEDEEIPTNITVADAIAAIDPLRIYEKQAAQAKLAEAPSETPTKRARDEGSQSSAVQHEPTEQRPTVAEKTHFSSPHRAHDQQNKAIGSTSSESRASVAAPVASQPREQQPHQASPSPSRSSTTHTISQSRKALNEGVVLVVDRPLLYTPTIDLTADDDDDDEADEDYVDDGQAADGDDDADDDDDDEGVEEEAEEDGQRNRYDDEEAHGHEGFDGERAELGARLDEEDGVSRSPPSTQGLSNSALVTVSGRATTSSRRS